MATEHDGAHLRRYLLGELTEEQTVALEEEYFARPDVVERIWATENDLVDDYVSDRLTASERERFVRHRLATPSQRARVAVARELRSAVSARPAAPPALHASNPWWVSMLALRGWPRAWQAAFAVALVLLAVGVGWIVASRPRPATITVAAPPSAPSQQPSDTKVPDAAKPPENRTAPGGSPVIVAFSLSPLTVRGADEGPSLLVPAGTDLVVLRLEDDGAGPALGRGRAVVRTVTGTEVWRGPAAAERGGRPATLARIEIPAGKLPPDDYIVGLFETGGNGRETERHRYFLRVRPR